MQLNKYGYLPTLKAVPNQYNHSRQQVMGVHLYPKKHKLWQNQHLYPVKSGNPPLRKLIRYGNKNHWPRYESLPQMRIPHTHAPQRPHYNNKLVSNCQRNRDLSDYDRALFMMESSNADGLNQLMNVPVGIDLYRFKVEQAKERQTSRGEVMKLIEESKLQRMKRSYESKNQELDRMIGNVDWTDYSRKGKLKKNMMDNRRFMNQVKLLYSGYRQDYDDRLNKRVNLYR